MLLENINPFVRQALSSTLNQQHTLDIHTKIKTVDCRLFYIVSGDGNIVIENKAYPLLPGMVILFSAGTEYIWAVENEMRYFSVNFDYTENFSHIKKTFHPIHSTKFSNSQIIERVYFDDMEFLNKPLIIENATILKPIVQQIVTEYCIKGEYTDALLSSLLKSAILMALRLHTNKGDKKEQNAPLVREMIEFINTHYKDDISNEHIANHFNFSSAYLNRVFRAHTGSSIHEFLIERRLSASMLMLRTQNLSVGEVALQSGFCSLHHFTKTFKKHVNMSPSEYRNFNI